jgi:hypothetical protein
MDINGDGVVTLDEFKTAMRTISVDHSSVHSSLDDSPRLHGASSDGVSGSSPPGGRGASGGLGRVIEGVPVAAGGEGGELKRLGGAEAAHHNHSNNNNNQHQHKPARGKGAGSPSRLRRGDKSSDDGAAAAAGPTSPAKPQSASVQRPQPTSPFQAAAAQRSALDG